MLVGDWWKDRLDCRQWGAHFPHVAGIAGQSTAGAQSVVLSGGYEDDRDEGEWFLYTGGLGLGLGLLGHDLLAQVSTMLTPGVGMYCTMPCVLHCTMPCRRRQCCTIQGGK